MDVGLHHGGIHAHSTPVRYSLVLRYFHHSFVNLLDHLRPESHAPAADGFGVGHLGAAHPAEVAIHQTRSACFIQSSQRSSTSAAINPSPKLSWARRILITG